MIPGWLTQNGGGVVGVSEKGGAYCQEFSCLRGIVNGGSSHVWLIVFSHAWLWQGMTIYIFCFVFCKPRMAMARFGYNTSSLITQDCGHVWLLFVLVIYLFTSFTYLFIGMFFMICGRDQKEGKNWCWSWRGIWRHSAKYFVESWYSPCSNCWSIVLMLG